MLYNLLLSYLDAEYAVSFFAVIRVPENIGHFSFYCAASQHPTVDFMEAKNISHFKRTVVLADFKFLDAVSHGDEVLREYF